MKERSRRKIEKDEKRKHRQSCRSSIGSRTGSRMRSSLSALVLPLCIAPASSASSTVANNRPIIGVLSVPLESGCITAWQDRRAPVFPRGRASVDAEPTSCFHNLYVEWLASGGARVVPIPYDDSRAAMERKLAGVNGLLFTGGEVVLKDLSSPYLRAAGYLLERALQINQAGTHFPVWGTCMGIQTLSVLVARTSRVMDFGGFDSEDLMLPLDLVESVQDTGRSSAMFNFYNDPVLGSLAKIALPWLASQSITNNQHHDGLPPEKFRGNAELDKFFRVLSTNKDRRGKEFVSTIEARNGIPVYGVQWHPERPQFEWPAAATDAINHSEISILSNQYVANFFVSEARKNDRAFLPEQEAEFLIYNYEMVGHTYYKYFFFSPEDDILAGIGDLEVDPNQPVYV